MRDRIRLLEGVDFVSSMSSVVAPTLLITGESTLDSVVPPHHTLGYTRFLPHAESLTFERTGHIGLVTRPAAFADRVATFVARSDRADQSRPGRRVAG
jgi:pimeloyl-ACP methyl ester carboxylesterase